MVLASTVSGAWTLLALLSSVGVFGLLMCRAMLRSPTASDLRRVADIATMQLASCSSLSTRQREAVFLALSASAPRLEPSMLLARSRGFRQAKPCTEV